jgi:hypothetical protein
LKCSGCRLLFLVFLLGPLVDFEAAGDVSPKRRFFSEQHGATTHNTEISVIIAVGTLTPTAFVFNKTCKNFIQMLRNVN